MNFDYLNYAIYEKTNALRARKSLSALVYSKDLSVVCSLHSTQMKKYDFFSHTNPYNPLLKDVKDRISYFNLTFSKVTENIADVPFLNFRGEQKYKFKKINNQFLFFSTKTGKQFFDHDIDSFSDYVLDSWMNSTGHRKNILDKSVTYLGCGAVLYFKEIDNEFQMPYLKVTQNFGKK